MPKVDVDVTIDGDISVNVTPVMVSTTVTPNTITITHGDIPAHEAASDPHPQYTTEEEVEALIVASTVTTLDELTDVTLDTPINNQVLTYNEITSQWENKDAQGSDDAVPQTYLTTNHVPSGFATQDLTQLVYVARTVTIEPVAPAFTFDVFINGTLITFTGAQTAVWDDDSLAEAFPNVVGRYFFYFRVSDNKFVWSANEWSLEPDGGYDGKALVCTVYYDGSTGILEEERHHSWRDIHWHHWGHHTVGTRWAYAHPSAGNGFAVTAPSVASPSTININQGTVYDEDIRNDTNTAVTCRLWYGDENGMNTITPYALPYKSDTNLANGIPQFFDRATNTLQSVPSGANSDAGVGHFVSWVYGTNLYDEPKLVIVADQRSTAATTLTMAQARLVSVPIYPENFILEWKLLYRMIWRRSGTNTITFREYADYRAASSLPAGVTPVNNPSAGNVSFNPDSYLTSTNVQAAIVELADGLQILADDGKHYKLGLIIDPDTNTPAFTFTEMA